MQKPKPWQIVLFVAAGLAILFVGYKIIRGDGISVEHDLLVVDIETGEVFEIDTNGRGIVLPAKNPATGERTMFPVYKDDEGQWLLESRGLASITNDKLKTGDFIDLETGSVDLDLSAIRRVNAKDLVKR